MKMNVIKSNNYTKKKINKSVMILITLVLSIVMSFAGAMSVSAEEGNDDRYGEPEIYNKVTIQLGEEHAGELFYLVDKNGEKYGNIAADKKGNLTVEVYGEDQEIFCKASGFLATQEEIPTTSSDSNENNQTTGLTVKNKIAITGVFVLIIAAIYGLYSSGIMEKILKKHKN